MLPAHEGVAIGGCDQRLRQRNTMIAMLVSLRVLRSQSR
jgi:hypothetical protein